MAGRQIDGYVYMLRKGDGIKQLFRAASQATPHVAILGLRSTKSESNTVGKSVRCFSKSQPDVPQFLATYTAAGLEELSGFEAVLEEEKPANMSAPDRVRALLREVRARVLVLNGGSFGKPGIQVQMTSNQVRPTSLY